MFAVSQAVVTAALAALYAACDTFGESNVIPQFAREGYVVGDRLNVLSDNGLLVTLQFTSADTFTISLPKRK